MAKPNDYFFFTKQFFQLEQLVCSGLAPSHDGLGKVFC